jgi:hypothetical protein
VAAVLMEYKQEGVDAEAIACHCLPYQEEISQPADHSALGLLRGARENPMVGGRLPNEERTAGATADNHRTSAQTVGRAVPAQRRGSLVGLDS